MRISENLGKQVVFVTNNSSKSRADYKKKLDNLGIPSTVVCGTLSSRRHRQLKC